MNQEMTEIPEEIKVTNSPSQITQRECFLRGYKQGFEDGFKKGIEHECTEKVSPIEKTDSNKAV
jgi:hypothetical protein